MRHQCATPFKNYVYDVAVEILNFLLLYLHLYWLKKWIKNWKRITSKCVFRLWRVVYTEREEAKVENPSRFAQYNVAYVVMDAS